MMAAGGAEERPEREHNGEQASPVESQENSVCTQGRTAPFAASLSLLFGPGAFAPSVGNKTSRNGAVCRSRRRTNDRARVEVSPRTCGNRGRIRASAKIWASDAIFQSLHAGWR